MDDYEETPQNEFYKKNLTNHLDKISLGILEKIDTIIELPLPIGKQVLAVLLEWACQTQNTNNILLGRNYIKQIHSNWLIKNLPETAKSCLNFEDEWDYRRLLELISEAVPALLNWAIKQGINSTNEEVREAAEDFRKIHNV